MVRMQEQLNTGIKELDDILAGGIPRHHSVVLAGSCGTGKTIMSQEFLFEGARKGEVGVYLSLSEPRDKIIRNLEDFKFFDNKIVDSGMVKIVDMISDAGVKGIDLNNSEDMIRLIRETIKDSEAKRVVIDSITALVGNFPDTGVKRSFIYELGFELMYLDCTTLLISEIPPQVFKYSVNEVEEFIADGVMLMTDFERKGDLLRAFQVIKMRGVKHSRNKFILKILQDGITLIPLFKAGIK